jgi:tRNA pseudouridine38-40 synthase
MNRAAESLLGTHDFSCFEKTGGSNKTSVCTVTEARWESYVPDHVRLMGFPAEEGDYLVFRISADRFLRNMVRAIVGTLLEVGRGRRSVESVAALLDGGATRSDAGESVPGNALFLSGVEY